MKELKTEGNMEFLEGFGQKLIFDVEQVLMQNNHEQSKNFVISSEISYQFPLSSKKILESPKMLNLSNSPENFFPSPEKVDLVLNSSS